MSARAKALNVVGIAHCVGAIPVLAPRSSTLDINQQSKVKNCLRAQKGDKCRVEAFLVNDLEFQVIPTGCVSLWKACSSISSFSSSAERSKPFLLVN